jgi:hypothetical protein
MEFPLTLRTSFRNDVCNKLEPKKIINWNKKWNGEQDQEYQLLYGVYGI